MPKNDVRVELRLGLLRHLRALRCRGPSAGPPRCRSRQSTLRDDPAQHLDGLLVAADRRPELGPVVQVERRDRAGRLRGLHPLDDELGRRLGERGEDAAGVEPAHAAGEDRLPVEVAGLEQRAGLVGAVVEDDRRRGRRGRGRCRRWRCSARGRRRARTTCRTA